MTRVMLHDSTLQISWLHRKLFKSMFYQQKYQSGKWMWTKKDPDKNINLYFKIYYYLYKKKHIPLIYNPKCAKVKRAVSVCTIFNFLPLKWFIFIWKTSKMLRNLNLGNRVYYYLLFISTYYTYTDFGVCKSKCYSYR